MRQLLCYLTVIILMPLGGAMAADIDLPVKSGSDYISPETVEGAETVDTEKAHKLWENRTVFVDVRKDTDFEAGRIPGAVQIIYDPGKDNQPLTEESLTEVVEKDQPFVCYCNGHNCDRSSWCAALANKWGWQEVYYYRDGFPAWAEAGHPVE